MKKFNILLYSLFATTAFLLWKCIIDDIDSQFSNTPYQQFLELNISYANIFEQIQLDKLVDQKGITEEETMEIQSIINRLQKEHTKDKNVNKGLIVDWWDDICIQQTSMELYWYPLFPKIPVHTSKMLKCGNDKKIQSNSLRRVYGFLYTETSTFYDFKLLSSGGAELLILDTKMPFESANSVGDLNTLQEIFYLKLSKEIMNDQDMKMISKTDLYNIEKINISIKANNLYYIEIIQVGEEFSIYEVQWRTQDSSYKIIGENNLIHTNSMSANSTPSMIYKKQTLAQRFPVNKYEERRISFHTISNLTAKNKINMFSFNCEKHEKQKKKISKLYEGMQYTDFMLAYPKEFFDFNEFQRINLRTLKYIEMNESKAKEIAHETFSKLNIMYNSLLELQHIVHVTTNVGHNYRPLRPDKMFHFVEFDLKFKGEDKMYRTTHYVKNLPTGICFMRDFQFEENVEINLLTPIRNQKHWLLYLIEMLEDLIEKTKEINIKLIVIDNNSTDGDYQEILKSSKIKHIYLNLTQTFNKVKSLNLGLKHVTDENSIAMVMDLHLQLPLNMFDRVRKFTIQNMTGFSPALMKLGCGEHEQYTDLKKSFWGDEGVGMMAMYKSDWTLIGGFNDKKFKKSWGGEDTEVIDRMVEHGLYLIHVRMPRFYHIYHSSAGMWDGKKPIQ